MLNKFTHRTEGLRYSSSFRLLLYCCLFIGAFFMSSGELYAQCQDSPPECQAAIDEIPGTMNGPDQCLAKRYCSNSGAVESGLINCTNAADTDGCGIDASVASPFINADAQTKALFEGSSCTTYDNLQWIVFVTPPTVTGTKIQAVGASDSFFLFYAGSFTLNPDADDDVSDGEYTSVISAIDNRPRCNQFDSSDLVLCSDTNQYESFNTQLTLPEFNDSPDAYNVYYIALFYDTPTNGSLNFKVKECEVFECPAFATNCPEDVNLDSCLSEAEVDTAFGNFLNGFTTGGGQNPSTEWFINDVSQGNTKPTVASLPADFQCGGSITIRYLLTDDCNIDYECERMFSVTADETDPEIADVPDYTLEGCNAQWPANLSTAWTDNCSAGGSIDSDGGGEVTTSADGCSQSRVYTFTVTDDCGNSDTETTTVTREYDVTDPQLTCPDPVRLCEGETIPSAFESYVDFVDAGGSASDNCGIDESSFVLVSEESDGLSPETITRTYSIADNCGNETTCTQTITVYDNPVCSIGFEGEEASDQLNACENQVRTYAYLGDDEDNYDYEWEIVGGGAVIEGASDGPTVDVKPNIGDTSFMLQLTITADYGDGLFCSSTCNEIVAINKTPQVEEDEVCVGETVDFSVEGNATYYSADDSIATIDANGIATGVSDGVVLITIILDEGQPTECSNSAPLTVFPLPEVSIAPFVDDICIEDGIIVLGGGSPEGGVYSGDGVTDDGNGVTFTFDPSGLGEGPVTITYTYSDANFCENSASTDITLISCAEGCTLGYWKNHTDRWCDSYSTCDLYGDVFEDAPEELADLTLLEVLNLGGGGIYNLGRQSVAALLNACSEGEDDINYGIPTVDGVIDYVNDNFDNANEAGSYLDELNNAGCTLGGSRATSAPSDDCEDTATVTPNDPKGKGKNSDLKVTPNPFVKEVMVRFEFGYSTNVTIDVVDITGAIIKTFSNIQYKEGSVGRMEIDLSNALDRMLFVRVTSDKETIIKKLVSLNNK